MSCRDVSSEFNVKHNHTVNHRYDFKLLMAALYYNVSWLSKIAQNAIKLHCLRDTDPQINSNNCRDALLVLQENITYSVENPSPEYEPFDPSIEPLIQQLYDHLQQFALQGLYCKYL